MIPNEQDQAQLFRAIRGATEFLERADTMTEGGFYKQYRHRVRAALLKHWPIAERSRFERALDTILSEMYTIVRKELESAT